MLFCQVASLDTPFAACENLRKWPAQMLSNHHLQYDPTNDSKKLTTHPDIAHPIGNPPTQLWKDSLYNLLVKV